MRNHQASQKKSAAQKAKSVTPNPLETHPFAVQPTHKETARSPETKGNESAMASFAILNPEGGRAMPVQPKLMIGAPGDKYEQEADRVASQVVKQLNSPDAAKSSQGQSVQRMKAPVEDLQAKPSIFDLQRSPLPLVQREAMPAEEEIQAKSIQMSREAIAGGDATTDLESAINSARGSGQPLDVGLQWSMGQAMGADFSGVKVHTDAQSDQLNQSIQARAFTTGQDVFFRQGAYDPGSRGGQELIAHELTHVVQQNGGEVRRSPLTTVQSVDSVTETQRVNQLQPFISGKIIQRTWDTSGDEPVYRDDVHKVNWHLCSDGELWYETYQESSPYTGYAGIKNKGSYAKWFMLGVAPFELIKEQIRTIQIPVPEKLDQKFHEAYQLYIYLIGISTLKWSDIVEKTPFSKLGWQVKKVYEHYQRYINPLVEKEDSGLDAYYGPFYKRMNPFLRAIRARFGDGRYDQIIEGDIGSDSAELVKILDEISKDAGFKSDIDESTLKDVLAEIRGAKKEIKKNSEITPINNTETPTVYRGDFAGLVDIMARECGFDKTVLDQQGTLDIMKNWTQFQFVSTTTNKQIGSPAETGTIWNINLGARSTGKSGGLYVAEKEVLFAPKTTFFIEKIVTPGKYDNSGPRGDNNTKYIVYARQG